MAKTVNQILKQALRDILTNTSRAYTATLTLTVRKWQT